MDYSEPAPFIYFYFPPFKRFCTRFFIFGGFTKDLCGVENGLLTEERTLCFSSKSKLY